MTAYSSDDDSGRLLQLSEEVSRIASGLAKLSMGLAAGRPLPDEAAGTDGADIFLRTVDRAFHARKARTRYFPQELFAEPAWDMLLHLFRCELRRRRVSTSDLCLAAGVPQTTAIRWISTMDQQGLVISEREGHEDQPSFITLSANARAALRRYFNEVAEGA